MIQGSKSLNSLLLAGKEYRPFDPNTYEEEVIFYGKSTDSEYLEDSHEY